MRVSAGGPPSGVVTFLFTDIEGSTRRWEADANALRPALLAHDEVLRAAIDAHCPRRRRLRIARAHGRDNEQNSTAPQVGSYSRNTGEPLWSLEIGM